jgi:HEAT repeat protein
MIRKTGILLLLFVCIGCGTSPPPQSGGRTAEYWAEVLGQSDVGLRRKAATKLGPLVLIDPAAFPALTGALKDPDAEVRASAARSLGVYSGPRGEEIIPGLRELQKCDPVPKVRQAAAKAIETLEAHRSAAN